MATSKEVPPSGEVLVGVRYCGRFSVVVVIQSKETLVELRGQLKSSDHPFAPRRRDDDDDDLEPGPVSHTADHHLAQVLHVFLFCFCFVLLLLTSWASVFSLVAIKS